MNVCLIAPPLQDHVNGRLVPISMDAARTCPPYGAYLLAAVLQTTGNDVVLVDLIAQGSSDLLPNIGSIVAADVVGIGTSSLSWPTARDCINTVRSYRPDVPIVLGGIHASMFDRYLLSTTEANFVIRGEAERAFPAFCRALLGGIRLEDVPNLSFKLPSGKIVRNAIGALLSGDELASYPVPDYSRIPRNVYMGLGVESSRGCTFDCAFCSTSYRRTWRGLSPDRFVDRLEQMLPCLALTVGGVTHIIDDEFSTETDRATAICRKLVERDMSPRLVFSSRANDLLDSDFVDAIAPFAHQFLVGAECGYDEGLKQVGKGTTCRKLRSAAEKLRDYGIAEIADFSFIIGLPWETKVEVMQTVQFGYDLYATYGVRILFQWYCQIPGSRLWAEQREREVLHEAHYDNYGFFRDHYLFRSGVQLKPSEVYEVQSAIAAITTLSAKNRYGMTMIECSVPEPILNHYPEIKYPETSLKNLREVAGPVIAQQS